MKNKTVIILLSVLAVALYTVAVINFCFATPGSIFDGIGQTLTACGFLLMAYTCHMAGLTGRLAIATGKILFELLEKLQDGIKGTLSIKADTEDEDPDEDGDIVPESELTEDEKRVKRMAEEYEHLTDRYLKLTHFLMTDTFEKLPENKQNLLKQQHQAMKDYRHILYQRLRIDAKEVNIGIDIKADIEE